jgi:hypothetical protein
VTKVLSAVKTVKGNPFYQRGAPDMFIEYFFKYLPNTIIIFNIILIILGIMIQDYGDAAVVCVLSLVYLAVLKHSEK